MYGCDLNGTRQCIQAMNLKGFNMNNHGFNQGLYKGRISTTRLEPFPGLHPGLCILNPGLLYN